MLKRAIDASDDDRPSKRQLSPAQRSTAASSSETGDAREDETLRISNEMLRSENEQLQREREELQKRHDALETQFSQQKQRVRNLEEDLTRMYRRQKRDAEARQAEHTQVVASLREELERRSMELEDRSALVSKLHATLNGADGATTLSKETAKEMDAFVAMCLQWQSRLASLSATLQDKVTRIEQDEVQRAMQDMVQRLENEQRVSDVRERECVASAREELLLQREDELKALMQSMQREREETDTFEVLERKVLEDRVLELEQALRAAQEIAEHHAAGVASVKSELARANAARQQSEEKAAELSVQCEAQHVQLTLLREDLASYQGDDAEQSERQHKKLENAAIVVDLKAQVTALSQQLEEQSAQRESERQAYEGQVASIRSELSQRVATLESENETLLNRIEVLNLNIDAKAKVIEGLQAERTSLLTKLAASAAAAEALAREKGALETDVAREREAAAAQSVRLQQQVDAKAVDWNELRDQLQAAETQLQSQQTESARLRAELDAAKQQNSELSREKLDREHRGQQIEETISSLESQQTELRRLLEESDQALALANQQLKRLEVENHELSSQVTALRTAPPPEQGVMSAPKDAAPAAADDDRLEQLLAEKGFVQQFLRCYYEAAEAKCRALSAQVSAFESRHEQIRKHADDSRHLLRMCSQVDGCDSVVRASILDVMTALDNIR
ncbi:hypothetical protein P43SY_008514 [Pythium insidiosum]|uniref:Uncharacterized protein n=1 Tax=Pythium insidiosum TaxID=114742 RepID=A0AAD5QCY0_PYTIN|nr:hypothetical protein P43SY_008514 [Pythium insidiosum]